MAMLNIRRRGATQLTKPQTQQVDYSAIGNNAYTRMQAQGGGAGIAKGIEAFARAATQGIEELNRNDEREATKAAQSVRIALDKEKELMLRAMEEDPSNATGWEEKWKAAQEKAYADAKVAEMGEYRRNEFLRQMEVHNHNGWASLYRTSNTVKDRADKQSADAELDSAAIDVWDSPAMASLTDPETGEKYGEVIDNEVALKNAYTAFERAAKANRWTPEEYEKNLRVFKTKLATGLAERKIASAGSLADIKALREAFNSIDSDSPDSANLTKAFGAVDYNALSPEARLELSRDLDRRETVLLRAQAAEASKVTAEQKAAIAAIETQYLQGGIGYSQLQETVTRAQSEGYPSEEVLKLQKLADRALSAEVDEWVAILASNPTLWDKVMRGNVKAVREIPEVIRNNPVFMKRLREARELGIETVRKLDKLAVADTVEQLVYGKQTQLGIPLQSRLDAIDDLEKMRRLSPEEAEKARREARKYASGKLASYAGKYADTVAAVAGHLEFATDADGSLVLDFDKTRSSIVQHFKSKGYYNVNDEDDVNNTIYLAGELKIAWTDFAAWCDMNPNAKDAEIRTAYVTRFAPFATVFTLKDIEDISDEQVRNIDAATRKYRLAIEQGRRDVTHTYVPTATGVERGSTREVNRYETQPAFNIPTLNDFMRKE